MAGEAIRVEGLREFSRDLKKLDNELPKALRLALNQAADVVVSGARPLVPTRSGRAARSLRTSSTRTASRVTGGGSRAPHYAWLDFGGAVPAWGGPGVVRRAFFSDGRYLYPTYFRKRDSGEFQEILQRALLDVARQAGVEVD